MNDHEQGQVGQEVQQVQGWNVLQLQSDGRLLLQVDSPGLQLQEQLLGADEALLDPHVSPLLLQEEQEQLLPGSGYQQKSVKAGEGWRRGAVCVSARSSVSTSVLLCSVRFPNLFLAFLERTCLHS